MKHLIPTPSANHRRWLAGLVLGSAALAPLSAVHAQSEPYIGQVIWTAANFCPQGWAAADGQLLPISGNEALFSLLGTNYGGNGLITFALPDLRGRVATHAGQGPGLSAMVEGQAGGRPSVTLGVDQLPAHNHALKASAAAANSANPAAGLLASPTAATSSTFTGSGGGNGKGGGGSVTGTVTSTTTVSTYGDAGGATVDLASGAVGNTGSGQPFDNQQPFLTLRACISLLGIFPSRG